MSKRITIADLARAASVSVSTIDRIMNRRGPVQRQTEEHVLSVAERIGFHAVQGLRRQLAETAPKRKFGFILNRRDRYLYARLASLLIHNVTSSPRIHGQAVVIHLEDLSPKGTADAILRLGEDCDALAGVCIDHPMVNAAVEKLAKANVPFWAMLSDLSTPARAGFVGANATKLGRSAGWFMHRLLPTGGRVAVLLGSSDYTAQCLYESGFRQYLSQKGSKIDILAPRETEENVEQAYALTRDILRIQPNLSGLFMAGGGIDGVIQALQDQHLTDMTLVSTELSEKTRTHLLQGSVDVALSHPAEVVATNVVHAMENNRPRGLDAMIVDVEHQIMVSESI